METQKEYKRNKHSKKLLSKPLFSNSTYIIHYKAHLITAKKYYSNTFKHRK